MKSEKTCACGCGKIIRDVSTWASGHNKNKAKDRFDWSNVVSDYEKYGSVEKVSVVYGCTLQAVFYQLKKRGVDTSLFKVDTSSFISDYEKMKSVVKVAKKNNCSTTVVTDYFKSIGVNLNHNNKELDTEIGLGRFGENIALKELVGSVDMNDKKINSPYDIEFNNLRIDVKTSKKRTVRGKKKDYFTFSTKNAECDYYLLIALGDENEVLGVFFIPCTSIKGKSVALSIDKENKWHEYKTTFEELNATKGAVI